MSSNINKTARQIEREKIKQSLLELNGHVNDLRQQVVDAFREVTLKLDGALLTTRALVELMGTDKVQSKFDELKEKDFQATKENVEKELAVLKEKNIVGETTDTVANDSLVLGVFESASSKRFMAKDMFSLSEEQQRIFLGHKVGDEIMSADKLSSFKIEMVHVIDRTKVQEEEKVAKQPMV